MQPLVGLIMGSKSDWPTMEHAADMLDKLGVPYETKVVSAHRTPDLLFDYAKTAADRGLKVIIAGAGGAAHLPGMVASQTSLPVLGVPVQSKALNGLDSLLSIVQMPGGIAVGTLAIGKAGATCWQRRLSVLSRTMSEKRSMSSEQPRLSRFWIILIPATSNRAGCRSGW